MATNAAALISVLVAALVGLIASMAIESLMTPKPQRYLARPWAAWTLHIGLWLLPYGLSVLLLGRPWFAAASVSAFLLMLVMVNNAKFRSLQEPFVFQDYTYFTDAIQHPRLYIPFLGWWKFLAAVTGLIVAVAVGFWGEAAPAQRFSVFGQLGGIVVVVGCAVLLLLIGGRKSLLVTFDPKQDIRTIGFLPCLWRYGSEERNRPVLTAPFESYSSDVPLNELPHLVAIQSESFFDPRPLFSGIRSDVLEQFDRFKATSIAHGKLNVPAWGANTVRTEFAFLTGIDETKLGVHRFNPYRTVAKGWELSSLATFLKRLGYRTVCIHPFPASFYQRDQVYPRLDFDEFIDIRAFGKSDYSGPYVGDTAVADKIAAILEEATTPTFIFAITMENHGPLHLEQTQPSEIDSLYTQSPPAECDDLTIYLRHLRNANQMIANLLNTLKHCPRPAGLCWYGDHVPILPSVYEKFGAPDGDVEYIFWSNFQKGTNTQCDLTADDLAINWLKAIGLVRETTALNPGIARPPFSPVDEGTLEIV